MRTNTAPWDYAKPRIFRPNYRCPTCGGSADKIRVVDEVLIICLKRRPCKTIILDAQAIQTLVDDYNYQHENAANPLDARIEVEPAYDPRTETERDLDWLDAGWRQTYEAVRPEW